MCSENDRVDVVDASLATLLSELIFGFTAAGAVKVELKRPSRPLPNAVDGMFCYGFAGLGCFQPLFRAPFAVKSLDLVSVASWALRERLRLGQLDRQLHHHGSNALVWAPDAQRVSQSTSHWSLAF